MPNLLTSYDAQNGLSKIELGMEKFSYQLLHKRLVINCQFKYIKYTEFETNFLSNVRFGRVKLNIKHCHCYTLKMQNVRVILFLDEVNILSEVYIFLDIMIKFILVKRFVSQVVINVFVSSFHTLPSCILAFVLVQRRSMQHETKQRLFANINLSSYHDLLRMSQVVDSSKPRIFVSI